MHHAGNMVLKHKGTVTGYMTLYSTAEKNMLGAAAWKPASIRGRGTMALASKPVLLTAATSNSTATGTGLMRASLMVLFRPK